MGIKGGGVMRGSWFNGYEWKWVHGVEREMGMKMGIEDGMMKNGFNEVWRLWVALIRMNSIEGDEHGVSGMGRGG